MLSLNTPTNYDRETSLKELRTQIEGMLSPEGFFAAFKKIFGIVHRHDGVPHNWCATPKDKIEWMGNINGQVVIFSIKLYLDERPGKSALIVKGHFLEDHATLIDLYAISVKEDTAICEDLRIATEDHSGNDSTHSVDVIVQLLLQLRDAK